MMICRAVMPVLAVPGAPWGGCGEMSTCGVARMQEIADPNQHPRGPDAAPQHRSCARDVPPLGKGRVGKLPAVSKKPHRFPPLAPAFCLGFAAFWL